VGLAELDQSRFQVGDDVENEDGILVRSAKMHDYEFPDALRAIARAGAGTNNIPIDRCSEAGIVVFNTPGANANAVKELVLCALLVASRDIMGGYDWVREQAKDASVDLAAAVEKGKSAFVGPELYHKSLGVIGLGAIGALVANIGLSLGMEVYGYDPFLSVDAALRLDRHVHVVKSVDELYKVCDYVTLHIPYTDKTKSFLDAEAIDKMKGHVRVLNLARGELVDDDAMIAALESGRVAKYVTDFPNNKIALAKNVVALPHLGASTPESEDNCAVMAARQLEDYLVNGNIVNSVNLPRVEMDWSGICRLCLIHRNIPAMLANITLVLSNENVNGENMTNKSRGDYAYTLVDVNARVGESVVNAIRAIPGMLRVRVINH
jgi:D-3-phosphoglycerate dehydrogenase